MKHDRLLWVYQKSSARSDDDDKIVHFELPIIVPGAMSMQSESVARHVLRVRVSA